MQHEDQNYPLVILYTRRGLEFRFLLVHQAERKGSHYIFLAHAGRDVSMQETLVYRLMLDRGQHSIVCTFPTRQSRF